MPQTKEQKKEYNKLYYKRTYVKKIKPNQTREERRIYQDKYNKSPKGIKLSTNFGS